MTKRETAIVKARLAGTKNSPGDLLRIIVDSSRIASEASLRKAYREGVAWAIATSVMESWK